MFPDDIYIELYKYFDARDLFVTSHVSRNHRFWAHYTWKRWMNRMLETKEEHPYSWHLTRVQPRIVHDTGEQKTLCQNCRLWSTDPRVSKRCSWCEGGSLECWTYEMSKDLGEMEILNDVYMEHYMLIQMIKIQPKLWISMSKDTRDGWILEFLNFKKTYEQQRGVVAWYEASELYGWWYANAMKNFLN